MIGAPLPRAELTRATPRADEKGTLVKALDRMAAAHMRLQIEIDCATKQAQQLAAEKSSLTTPVCEKLTEAFRHATEEIRAAMKRFTVQ